jgi:amidase
MLTEDRFHAYVDAGSSVVEHAASGPLSGLSLAVKDIFDVKGLRTGAGNPRRAANAPAAAQTAAPVLALLEAGARFNGKTQTDELAFSLLGNNRHYSHPINAAAPDRFTGGSSSGSAAAVRGGLADIACGSDTAGSIRVPACFCGLIGLRTTFAAISLAGATPLAPSFDSFGWFAKDLPTYLRVCEVLLPSDAQPRFRRLLRCPDLDGLVGPKNEFSRIAETVGQQLSDVGELRSPISTQRLREAFRVMQGFEAWRNHGEWVRQNAEEMNDDVVARFRFGETVSPEDYAAASTVKRDFTEYLVTELQDDGLLLLPTVPDVSPRVTAPPEELDHFRSAAVEMLSWSPLSGLPQLHLPIGCIDGVPWGVSVLGPKGSDTALLKWAAPLLIQNSFSSLATS